MNKRSFFIIGLIVGLVVAFNNSSAQGFLHRDGKKIVDGQGNNFIIRSIGTGNWMLQEGYMMHSAGIAGTQHEFRAKLIEEIGTEKTDSFYNIWLANHFTRTDVDSMKAWGFNAIRPALHYKWFTLPIEEETDENTHTWLNKGFEMVDSLIAWCSDNEMYVILDMHGTPGGQGTNADISDYDPSKPALWESQQNKDKLIALWKKLAERYSHEPWIGGYDLINETNWWFTEGSNAPLWNLLKEITTAIREVDQNHLIFTEGNGFANDYSAFPGLWDENMALSFHKYWTYNDEHSLDWMLALQNQYNVPLWLGESGENSNTWFTNLIALVERKNIGWSWWPVKKSGINNVLNVTLNADYDRLIKSWRGEVSPISAEATFNAVMTFAENHKIENCKIQYDVIDAMLRQPHTFETKAFKNHEVNNKIYFTDYDLGRNNYAYFDKDTANYSIATGNFTAWNKKWNYRNDGVDIEACTDNYASNGFNVGFTEKGEWLQYIVNITQEALYTIDIRSASKIGGSVINMELNGVSISENHNLPNTGGWQSWKTTSLTNVHLPEGESKIRIYIGEAGSNLNYFEIKDPQSIENLNFDFLSAKTEFNSRKVYVTLNKEISVVDASIAANDLKLLADNEEVTIAKVAISDISKRVLILTTYKDLLYNQSLSISYSGVSIAADDESLLSFEKKYVLNNLLEHTDIPGKIEAEGFQVNNGFEIEDCSDFGEGYDLGYADVGDYIETYVNVAEPGTYKLNYRLASAYDGAQIITYAGPQNNLFPIDTLSVASTGGWQTWRTQSSEVQLNKGVQYLRLYVKQGEFNINWVKFSLLVSVPNNDKNTGMEINPNPAQNKTTLKFSTNTDIKNIKIFDVSGKVVFADRTNKNYYTIETRNYKRGVYLVSVKNRENRTVKKLIIN